MAESAIQVLKQRIKEIRPMSIEELAARGWSHSAHLKPVVLVLENNIHLYAAMDSKGSGPGVMMASSAEGVSIRL